MQYINFLCTYLLYIYTTIVVIDMETRTGLLVYQLISCILIATASSVPQQIHANVLLLKTQL